MAAARETQIRLDGGVATELEKNGLSVTAPWWTTSALLTEPRRSALRGVHAAYLAAGAQVITANTFRCNIRALRAVGGVDAAGMMWMVHAAVGVARAARNDAGGTGSLVAGSMAPVEDCYRPDLVPPSDELRREHRWLATELLRAGVDLVVIETMNTEREARIALEQALSLNARAWVSFVCGANGRLLSGEPVAAAAALAASDGAEAVLVNCTPPADTLTALMRIRETYDGPLGAYPNLERRRSGDGHSVSAPEVRPETFAAMLMRWREEVGISLLGGCCGAGPEHIAALRERLEGEAGANAGGEPLVAVHGHNLLKIQ